MGHEVKLLPARSVNPFMTDSKNDRHDARTIWTGVQQSHVKAVAVKTEGQQAMLTLHRVRGIDLRYTSYLRLHPHLQTAVLEICSALPEMSM